MKESIKRFLQDEWAGLLAILMFVILYCVGIWLILDNRRIAKEAQIRDVKILQTILYNKEFIDKIHNSLKNKD